MGQLTLEVVGARKLSRALMRSSAATGPEVRAAARGTARRSVVLFRGTAPKKTGKLHAGIRMNGRSGMFEVTAHARNPDTGYDYVGVTRFGHRKRRITPTGRNRASVIETQRPRGRGTRNTRDSPAAALRFVIGGRVVYRKSVKGYKPKDDWAERALPAIALYSRGALKQAGERILQAV